VWVGSPGLERAVPREHVPAGSLPLGRELGLLGSAGARTDLLPAPGWSAPVAFVLEQLPAVAKDSQAALIALLEGKS